MMWWCVSEVRILNFVIRPPVYISLADRPPAGITSYYSSHKIPCPAQPCNNTKDFCKCNNTKDFCVYFNLSNPIVPAQVAHAGAPPLLLHLQSRLKSHLLSFNCLDQCRLWADNLLKLLKMMLCVQKTTSPTGPTCCQSMCSFIYCS